MNDISSLKRFLEDMKYLRETNPKEYAKMQSELLDLMGIDEEQLFKRISTRVGRRSLLSDLFKGFGAITGIGLLSKVASAETVITDKDITVNGIYEFPQIIPASAIVYKQDGKVIARNMFGKVIADGTNDADVILGAVDYAVSVVKSKEIVNGEHPPAVIYIQPDVYRVDKTISIRYTYEKEGVGSVQVPVHIISNGAVIYYDCEPLFHVEPIPDGAVCQEFHLKGFKIYGDWTKDCIWLLRWHGYIRDVRAVGVKRGVVMEMAWGGKCGIVSSAFTGNPNSDEGVLHVIPARWDNTNNVVFLDSYFICKDNNTPGYSIKWDDSWGHSCYFICVNNNDNGGAGVYLKAKGYLQFIRCHLQNGIDDDQGGANYYIQCDLHDDIKISGIAQKRAQISNCTFQCMKSRGQIRIIGAVISSCDFIGETILGNVDVSSCTFYPEREAQDFILRVYSSGRLSDIKIYSVSPATDTHIVATNALEIGTPDHYWTTDVYINNLEIRCRKTQVGIKRYLGGSDDFPAIISQAYIEINNDLEFDPSTVYAIYNDGMYMILNNIEIWDRRHIGNFANSFTKLTLRNCAYSRTYNPQYSNNSGTATFSGDATTKQFAIPHGLVTKPSKYKVWPLSPDAAMDFYLTADDTYIYVNYLTAPPAGTDNVVLGWEGSV